MRVALGRGALGLLLAMALAGCLRVGPGEDLHLVCEEKGNTPGAGYSLVDLVDITRVQNATLSEDEERAILAPVQPHVLTLAKRHHESPSATLERLDAPGRWRFHMTGTWIDGTVDSYDVIVQDGVARETTGALRQVALPASVLAEAQRVAAREAGLDDVRTRTPHLVGSGYDPALPACAFLSYADRVSEPGTVEIPEHPRTFVTVNLGQGRVVDVERAFWP